MGKLLYVKAAGELVTLEGEERLRTGDNGPRTGEAMSQLGIIRGGSIIARDGEIVFAGADEEALEFLGGCSGETETVDARGMVVTPGLVDPHTHLVYAGSREEELEQRLQGDTYLQILQRGGGILSTARRTAEAAEDELFAEAYARLNQFLLHGVTTLEAKSGYGLTPEAELKQLRVARRLDERHAIDVVSTFMGAHAVPPSFHGNTDGYVRQVVEEMLPAVAAAGLAEYCDVFCERGVFDLAQSERILRAAAALGFRLKVHADEIAAGFGGAGLAARVGAVSAEHLLKTSPEDRARLAQSGTVAVLLPGTALFLMEQAADARAMIAEGVAVALSTDCNPGSSPTVSMPFIMNAACLTMRMTPAEALTASTFNAACAIGREKQIGSLRPGKQADLTLFAADNYRKLQYHYGMNLVHTVIKKGRVVVSGGVLVQGE
ncbi:imidazolonepropionase [Paenibacillus tepidiphilus]|uniref:imidazolonepropionase n=1 Tax=Paenibacillus tepidiphilus TaxID=2608683 RepID=UPI0012386AA7|nr:imidazolonepropionase [Paenibacillus tepidiphilus]